VADEELTREHTQRLSTLRAERVNWDSQWEEAAARLLPAHVDSFTGLGNTVGGGGQKKTEQQFDSTAAFAAQRFSSVMESLATPQSSIWHLLKPIDKMLRRNRQVRLFFDELSESLFSYRYRPVANFVGNSQQVYLSLGVYGNGTLFVDKPDGEKGLRYRNIHLAETYFAENHAGIIDTLYRVFKMTNRQIVQKFGDKAPESVKEAAKDARQADVKSEVLHCVLPRSEADYDPRRVDKEGMGRFASLYIHVPSKTVMRKGGFATFPFAIARYTQASGEVYGRGPAQMVLPAIKTLNEEKKTVLKQGHRVVDPVLMSHDDGNLGTFSMKAGALNPGGVNKDGKALVHVLPTGNIAVGEKMMDLEKAVINDAFLVTLFQILIDTPQMTATEVLERAREKGMLLAPTAGRLQAEFLGPLIEREIELMAQQGLMPRVPQILLEAEAEYRIEYDSPMSRMQRAEKASGFMRALDSAANYAKMTGDVAPLDFFNFDVATPEILDINGAPTRWTRSMEEVEAIRAERQKAQQAAQMVEAAPAMASVVKSIPAPKG
jgi:hypothetical protein